MIKSDQNHRENSDEHLFEQFVGPNAAYYIVKWDTMRDRQVSWNWPAFFFGEGWLLYRKMYLYAVIYSMARLMATPFLASVASFSNQLLSEAAPMFIPYSIVLNLVLGLYGNALYKLHAKQKLRYAKASFKPDHLALGVQSLGGVSLLALLLIPVLAMLERLLLLFFGSDVSFNWTQTYQII